MSNNIAFVNGKGGCSKTTSIFHIAGTLAAMGEKVLVIDLDKQRNVTSSLLTSRMSDEIAATCIPRVGTYNEFRNPSVLDFFLGRADITEVVQKSYFIGKRDRVPKYWGIDVLPSDIRLEHERLLKDVDIKEKLNTFIQEQGYTWVLIDMPPSNKAVNDICFTQIANYVIAPFSSDLYSVSGYGDLMQTINNARELNDSLHILGVYLSRYMENCAVDAFIRDQLLAFGDIFIDIQIPMRADIREGVMFGRPMSFYKPKSQSTKAYERLVKEIKERIANVF